MNWEWKLRIVVHTKALLLFLFAKKMLRLAFCVGMQDWQR